MHKLLPFCGDGDGDEAWLFADLFASLLMTIVLLVNAHSVTTQPKNVTDTGANDTDAHLIYLEGEKIIMDDISNQAILMSTMIKKLQTENARAEVVGRASNNGLQLFELFQLFQESGIKYSYSISQ